MRLVSFLLCLFLSANSWASDPVVFSFAFFGCNRLDKEGVEKTGSKSTANEAQLLQDFGEIAGIGVDYVFLAGDNVKGLESGDKALRKQLQEWISLKKDIPDRKLVVFTGNHELLKKEGHEEVPNPPAYALWPALMQKFIAGDDGPRPSGPDNVVNDESRLSYTFRRGPYLFVVLNTDTQIDDRTIGDIPLKWVEKKLKEADEDKSVKHVFVMGHKPILSPKDELDDGERNIRKSQARDFYALLNGSAKVRVYMSAHAHEWNYSPSLFGGKIPQIVAGNGGSPPDKYWRGKGAYFGYTVVSVRQSGKIEGQSFGRNIPDPYYRQEAPRADRKESFTLYGVNR